MAMRRVPVLRYESISFGELIACGGFGAVYKGTWFGQPVAVKKFLKLENMNAFEKEAENLSLVPHPNIIQLYGVMTHEDTSYIVMECAENGSLFECLHIKRLSYSAEQAFDWIMQCAAGIAYLHSRTPKLLHRDLKSPNLLLSNGLRKLKICDFGQVVQQRSTMTKDRGTPRWTAPEVYQGTHYTEKCDVFSWAIVFWEVRAQTVPYKHMDRNSDVIEAQIRGERPPVPSVWLAAIRNLITKCWSQQPEARMNMADIVNELISIKNANNIS